MEGVLTFMVFAVTTRFCTCATTNWMKHDFMYITLSRYFLVSFRFLSRGDFANKREKVIIKDHLSHWLFNFNLSGGMFYVITAGSRVSCGLNRQLAVIVVCSTVATFGNWMFFIVQQC